MDKFIDIADRARILAKFAPESSKSLLAALDGLRTCRDNADLAQFIETDRHNVRCYEANCREARGLMNELVLLCRKFLPDLRLKWVRMTLDWRYDDPKLDWTPIIAELQLIEDEALTRTGTAKLPSKQKLSNTRRSTTTIDRDSAWLDEFKRDGHDNKTYFAQQKGVEPATMRAALKRAEAARMKPKRKSSKRS